MTKKQILNWKSSSLILLTALAPSFAFSAGPVLEVGSTVDSSDNMGSKFTVLIPISSSGDIKWGAIIGGSSSQTKTGRFVTQQYTNAPSQVVALPDGQADYLIIGFESRRLILDTKWLESYVRATYNERTGGTTQFGVYERATGRSYDPLGGTNLGFGIDAYLMGSAKAGGVSVGFEYVKSSEDALYLKLRYNN